MAYEHHHHRDRPTLAEPDYAEVTQRMVAAEWQLGITYRQFLHDLPDAVPVSNLWLGLGKGAVFGVLIALIACHVGLRIKPNTESLGIGTTDSVVAAITVVIVVDAIAAVMFSEVGWR